MFDSIANKFRLNFAVAALRCITIVCVALYIYFYSFSHVDISYGILFLPWMIAGVLLLGIIIWLAFIKHETEYSIRRLSIAQLFTDTILVVPMYIGATHLRIGGVESYFLVPFVYSMVLFGFRVSAILGWLVSAFLAYISSSLSPFLLSFGFAGTIGAFISESLKNERTELYKTKQLITVQERQVAELKRGKDASDFQLSGAQGKLEKLDEAKSEFITLLTHELRTPIAAVRWILESLKDTAPAASGELIEKGEQSIDRVNILIDRINSASTEAPYVFKREPISNFLAAIVRGFQAQLAQKNITFKLLVPQNVPGLSMDASKLRIALEEVIGNAVIFTPSGGAVSVSIDTNEVNTSRPAVIIRVADSGIGIDPGERQKVFNKFFRGSRAQKIETDGTGLGLYLAQEIVGKHGGSIWFDDNPGGGSVFSIRIPLSQ